MSTDFETRYLSTHTISWFYIACLLDLYTPSINHELVTMSGFNIDIYIIIEWHNTSETSNMVLPTSNSFYESGL